MMLLTDDEIPYEVGNDNMAYHGAYLKGAKAQLKAVIERLFLPCPEHKEWIYMCPRCVRTMCEEIFADLDIDVDEWERQSILDEVN